MKTYSEIFKLLKPRVSTSVEYKDLKHLSETQFALPKVGNNPSGTVRIPKLIKKTREKV